MTDKKAVAENTYVIAPEYKRKFRPQTVKEIIKDVLGQKLEGHTVYNPEATPLLTKQVADEIKERLKDLPNLSNRYKFMVQVIVAEQKGQGCRLGQRCFWDDEVDAYASETWSNDVIFAIATAYGVYHY